MKLGKGNMDVDPEINLISLIDVLFCLILFLVVTTTFNQRSMLKLELPQSRSQAQVDSAESLVVLIDAEGKYFVGNNEVLKTDVVSLKEAIARVAGDDRSQAVILRADGRTAHQSVVTAMDALGQLGFTKLKIATTPETKNR
ncbi:MAG TPA: biopolymer transporter ExbD [Arenimonas sp.]|uniref:ExbD/TolR family protein n=1 Tax=Arenimonas sp. TaxID=1872635 RepID=UPI002BF1B89C|nr:biopolymer transporter ExbD [Arenimonas sp.]HMB57315.1 biopolymer transporter ExbD [Arenimonas sp.]